MKMNIVQKYTKKKNKNIHTMNELGLIGTQSHKLYHKINVFTAKTL